MLNTLLQGEQAEVVLDQPLLWEAQLSCSSTQLRSTEQSTPFSTPQGAEQASYSSS